MFLHFNQCTWLQSVIISQNLDFKHSINELYISSRGKYRIIHCLQLKNVVHSLSCGEDHYCTGPQPSRVTNVANRTGFASFYIELILIFRNSRASLIVKWMQERFLIIIVKIPKKQPENISNFDNRNSGCCVHLMTDRTESS